MKFKKEQRDEQKALHFLSSISYSKKEVSILSCEKFYSFKKGKRVYLMKEKLLS